MRFGFCCHVASDAGRLAPPLNSFGCSRAFSKSIRLMKGQTSKSPILFFSFIQLAYRRARYQRDAQYAMTARTRKHTAKIGNIGKQMIPLMRVSAQMYKKRQ